MIRSSGDMEEIKREKQGQKMCANIKIEKPKTTE